jgi:hypothetical protein
MDGGWRECEVNTFGGAVNGKQTNGKPAGVNDGEKREF